MIHPGMIDQVFTVHTAELVVPDPSCFEVETAVT
jgi:hypothetical protein